MKKSAFKYYHSNRQVYAAKLNRGNFNEVLKLIANHGAVERYAADEAECQIDFVQNWPDSRVHTLKRGMYLVTENSGLKALGDWEFNYSPVLHMPSYYYPTDDEVKIIKCLNWDAELCYGYDYITSETGLDRATAKKAIDNLRSMGVVQFYRGLMTDDGEVAGSGFCVGDRHKAEALLYRHYGEGNREQQT